MKVFLCHPFSDAKLRLVSGRGKNPQMTPYGRFLKWWYPQIIQFNRVFHYKPSIFGVPLFLETPIFECGDTFSEAHHFSIYGKKFQAGRAHSNVRGMGWWFHLFVTQQSTIVDQPAKIEKKSCKWWNNGMMSPVRVLPHVFLVWELVQNREETIEKTNTELSETGSLWIKRSAAWRQNEHHNM